MFWIKLRNLNELTRKVYTVETFTLEARDIAVAKWHELHASLKGEESLSSNFDPRLEK